MEIDRAFRVRNLQTATRNSQVATFSIRRNLQRRFCVRDQSTSNLAARLRVLRAPTFGLGVARARLVAIRVAQLADSPTRQVARTSGRKFADEAARIAQLANSRGRPNCTAREGVGPQTRPAQLQARANAIWWRARERAQLWPLWPLCKLQQTWPLLLTRRLDVDHLDTGATWRRPRTLRHGCAISARSTRPLGSQLSSTRLDSTRRVFGRLSIGSERALDCSLWR